MTFTKKDEAFVDLALDTLTAIAKLVGGATGDTAGSVLTVLRVIMDSLEHAHDGKVTPDHVRTQMKQLTDAIHGNDGAADEALHRKFPKNDPDPEE
jgi:hypothetical protein